MTKDVKEQGAATHALKIDAQPMDDLLSGAKTGEVRRDDRSFMVGDRVHLTCADGRETCRRITHIQRGYGLPDDLCVLSYGAPAAPPADEVARLKAESTELREMLADAYGCNLDWHSLLKQRADDEAVKRIDAVTAERDALKAEVERKDAEIARLREALTPSGATKAAYHGEFAFHENIPDEDGNDVLHLVYVPWDTVKKIMAAISARAHEEGEG